MVQDSDMPQRSSSPLKRRASTMEPESEAQVSEDVDMISLPPERAEAKKSATSSFLADASMSPEQPAGMIEAHDPPSIDEQIRTIETLLLHFENSLTQVGDKAYVVSRKWLLRAQAKGGDAKFLSKAVIDEPLGPVDNSDILDAILSGSDDQPFAILKPGLAFEDFQLVPEEAWNLLISWYGLTEGQIPIVRTAHNTAPDSASLPNTQFELYPLIITLHRLWSRHSPIPIQQTMKQQQPKAPSIVYSTAHVYNDFLKDVKRILDVDPTRRVRLWRVTKAPAAPQPQVEQLGISTPPDSPERDGASSSHDTSNFRGIFPWLLLDVAVFLDLVKHSHRELIDFPDTTVNPKYNDKANLAIAGLMTGSIVVDEYVERDTFISTFTAYSNSTRDQPSANARTTTTNAIKGSSGSGRNSPGYNGPVTRGRAQQRPGRALGCVGLQNLGNTCYMNSALQCVRSVEELTKYFLSHEAQKEINPDNPLSHNGDVAAAYGHLLEELYRDPPPPSFAPRQFKGIIGKYAPAFSGYGQQDSQEFVGFLLDGLQEDLNRIKKKPYIEKPDSTDEMVNDPNAIREMADKVWDITKKRDDSVIADLFTGMYKSTLVCPVCSKISITFDPFTNLTLPLPVANLWTRQIRYYPLNDTPVEICVDIDRNSSIKGLKEFVSARVGVPVDRLFAAEEFRNKFFKFYDDLACVSEEIQATDIAAVHELESVPTNVSVSRKLKKQKPRSMLSISIINDDDVDDVPSWDDSAVDRLLVPITHRIGPDDAAHRRGYGNKMSDGVAPPHFIVLTRQEARSEDAIRRKILERVATFTTWEELHRDEEHNSDHTDTDLGVTSTSDADSSGSSKVLAESIESEEDLVDVTMKDAGRTTTVPAPPAPKTSQVLKKFNDCRPKWIDPNVFLDPQFQNLFEMGYHSETGASMPSSWQGPQDDQHLPRLSSRALKSASSDVGMRSPGLWEGAADSSGGETPDDHADSANLAADDSSADSAEDFPSPANIPVSRPTGVRPTLRGRGGRKAMRQGKTYGKAANKHRNRERRIRSKRQAPVTGSIALESGDESDESEHRPLVRPGEGIVVDWREAAYETVFGGRRADHRSGMPTFVNFPVLEDPALDAKRKQRQLRKKSGVTLDECLAEFEKEEILSEQDTWYCPRCKEHRRASKKFDLWKTPDILIVHLKRFSSNSWRRDKLEITVDFPVEGLDLSERVIEKATGKREIFDLIAVDDHWGGLGGGHYTAFAKNFVDGQWYEYNDSSVSRQSDTRRIVTPSAYLLFYRRRSEGALGGPKFQEIFERYERGLEDESGPSQRLGAGVSQQHGLSSALNGGAVVLHDQASPVRGRSGKAALSHRSPREIMDEDDDLPPPYGGSSTLGHGQEEGDTTNWARRGVSSGVESAKDQEMDVDSDGILGLGASYAPKWSFSSLPPQADNADDDVASDVAVNSSTDGGDHDSIGGQFLDDVVIDEDQRLILGDDQPMDNQVVDRFAVGDRHGASLITHLSDEAVHTASLNRAERDDMVGIRDALWGREQPLLEVPPKLAFGSEADSEKVTEIRIGDDDGDDEGGSSVRPVSRSGENTAGS